MRACKKNLSEKIPGTFQVKLGRADIPTFAVSTNRMGILNSNRALVNYIETKGSYQEHSCSDKEAALKLCREFDIPNNSIWFMQVVHIADKLGLPDEQMFFQSGIRN